jgi:hypothetical protein
MNKAQDTVLKILSLKRAVSYAFSNFYVAIII